jgi:putative transposase
MNERQRRHAVSAYKMKQPPKRLRRLEIIFSRTRPIFFLTSCTAARRPLLANVEAHNLFVSFCRLSPEKAAVWVGRYVLMPDHAHVFVSAEDSAALSRWVGSFKKYLAAQWRKTGLNAPFWQEGFFDHLLRSNESYNNKWEYVLQNPVRAGSVEEARDWPYAGEIHALEWDSM